MSRKFVSLAVLLILLAASLALASGVSAGTCVRVTVRFLAHNATTLSGTLTATYSVDGNEIGSVEYDDLDDLGLIAGGSNIVIGRFIVRDVDRSRLDVSLGQSDVTISGSGIFSAQTGSCGGVELFDGRLNPYDAATLAIIYANGSTQGYDIFAVNPTTSRGTLVIRATRAQVNAALADATASGGVNTLIAARGDISLWALTSGECQMNSFYADGSLSEFIFDCALTASEPEEE
jgi:hypothetical protein